MPWTSDHVKWLIDTGRRLKTADEKDVEIWELRHKKDDKTLSAWATHFRNHYCLDVNIDSMRGRRSRKKYLNDIKLPCQTSKLGPSIRAGDFGEILVADYLQWILKFWVPRVRWGAKIIRDESPKGSDVIGFQFHRENKISNEDILSIFEAKTKFSKGAYNKSRLQDAINDSAKDHLRIDESLNYIKQKLLEHAQHKKATLVDRFQSPVDLPYKEIFGAVAVFSEEFFSSK
ncbi:MAG: Hachiman antiphage defense system protein HamA [Syntrophaceae bacterium]